MKVKNDRIETLKMLISSMELGSQEEVLQALQREGFTLTQATLSRDLKQLKVAKAASMNGKYVYVLPNETMYKRVHKTQTAREMLESPGYLSINFSGNLGVAEAQEISIEKGLDLVMIAPQATPPVCRIMDYGKFRFEQDKREKEAKKKQQVVEIKEIQLTYNIGEHDFQTKLGHAKRFLQSGNKVRVVLKFKGRQMAHTDVGQQVVDRFEAECAEFGTPDKKSVLDGRTITLFLSPISNTTKK